MVLAETIGNDQWEASRTLTHGKKTSDFKFKKPRRVFDHFSHCVVCKLGGHIYLCDLCPRVVHAQCIGMKQRQLDRMQRFFCPSHRCKVCDRNTIDAGGMLYWCQTCPHSYCEDCLPSDDLSQVGPTIPEFTLMGYPQVAQSYFIQCPECIAYYDSAPKERELFEAEQRKLQSKVEAEHAEAYETAKQAYEESLAEQAKKEKVLAVKEDERVALANKNAKFHLPLPLRKTLKQIAVARGNLRPGEMSDEITHGMKRTLAQKMNEAVMGRIIEGERGAALALSDPAMLQAICAWVCTHGTGAQADLWLKHLSEPTESS